MPTKEGAHDEHAGSATYHHGEQGNWGLPEMIFLCEGAW